MATWWRYYMPIYGLRNCEWITSFSASRILYNRDSFSWVHNYQWKFNRYFILYNSSYIWARMPKTKRAAASKRNSMLELLRPEDQLRVDDRKLTAKLPERQSNRNRVIYKKYTSSEKPAVKRQKSNHFWKRFRQAVYELTITVYNYNLQLTTCRLEQDHAINRARLWWWSLFYYFIYMLINKTYKGVCIS